jgi:hypothetical protein
MHLEPTRLALFATEDVVYWPVGREQWVLLRWLWATPTDNGTRIACEVIAEQPEGHGCGRTLWLEPQTQVYQLNEMETLAVAGL